MSAPQQAEQQPLSLQQLLLGLAKDPNPSVALVLLVENLIGIVNVNKTQLEEEIKDLKERVSDLEREKLKSKK